MYPGDNVCGGLIQKLTVNETCTIDGRGLVKENVGTSTYWFGEVNSIPDFYTEIKKQTN